MLNRMCKYTLGIPKNSSNIAAKGELGIYHLNIEVCIRMPKIFFHLLKLIKEGNKLIYSAVIECAPSENVETTVVKNQVGYQLYFIFFKLHVIVFLQFQITLKLMRRLLLKI